ncbi:MAG: cupin domain-containing protein [Acidiferrobacterales bacterium]
MNDQFPQMWAGAHPWRVTIEEAKAAPIPEGARSALLMQYGTMLVRYYAPKGADPQIPHEQDEVYVIASGSGTFVNGDERVPFTAGDVLFTPAKQVHRFEAFTDDFATWVIFYGPQGGEQRQR